MTIISVIVWNTSHPTTPPFPHLQCHQQWADNRERRACMLETGTSFGASGTSCRHSPHLGCFQGTGHAFIQVGHCDFRGLASNGPVHAWDDSNDPSCLKSHSVTHTQCRMKLILGQDYCLLDQVRRQIQCMKPCVECMPVCSMLPGCDNRYCSSGSEGQGGDSQPPPRLTAHGPRAHRDTFLGLGHQPTGYNPHGQPPSVPVAACLNESLSLAFH